MSDYEKFIKTPGRDDLIKQVRKRIDALGIEYLYLQFVSVTGRIMGKGIPADHWENVANGGFQLVYGATVNLFLNRHGQYLGYGPEAAELVGVPRAAAAETDLSQLLLRVGGAERHRPAPREDQDQEQEQDSIDRCLVQSPMPRRP